MFVCLSTLSPPHTSTPYWIYSLYSSNCCTYYWSSYIPSSYSSRFPAPTNCCFGATDGAGATVASALRVSAVNVIVAFWQPVCVGVRVFIKYDKLCILFLWAAVLLTRRTKIITAWGNLYTSLTENRFMPCQYLRLIQSQESKCDIFVLRVRASIQHNTFTSLTSGYLFRALTLTAFKLWSGRIEQHWTTCVILTQPYWCPLKIELLVTRPTNYLQYKLEYASDVH